MSSFVACGPREIGCAHLHQEEEVRVLRLGSRTVSLADVVLGEKVDSLEEHNKERLALPSFEVVVAAVG